MSKPLSTCSDAELKAELKRRKDEWEPSPAFKCACRGKSAYFSGSFSAAAFERQKEQFDKIHVKCLPLFNGGGI